MFPEADPKRAESVMRFTKLVVLMTATILLTAMDAGADGWVPRPGIEASGSYGTVTRSSEEPGGIPESTNGGGWSVGATAEWTLGTRWGLVSGLRYLEEGQSETFDLTAGTTTVRGDMHDTWQWLAVPLRVRVTPWAAPLSFEAGPEVQYLLVAKSDQDLENGAQSLVATGGSTSWARRNRLTPAATIFEGLGTFGGDKDVTGLYNRTNFVLGGGVSYGWPMRSGRLTAGARGQFGLVDLMKSDSIDRHTRTVEFALGWQW